MNRPVFVLVPLPGPPVAGPTGAGAAAPAPRLTRRQRRHLGRVSKAIEDRDLLLRWPALVVRWADLITATLVSESARDKPPAEQALLVISALALMHGGRDFRLPHPGEVARVLREARIYREWDGRNAGALAQKYRLDLISVYKIIRRQRALRKAQLAQRAAESGGPLRGDQ